MSIRVCVAGATGWAGRAVVRGILASDKFELAGALAGSAREKMPGSYRSAGCENQNHGFVGGGAANPDRCPDRLYKARFGEGRTLAALDRECALWSGHRA